MFWRVVLGIWLVSVALMVVFYVEAELRWRAKRRREMRAIREGDAAARGPHRASREAAVDPPGLAGSDAVAGGVADGSAGGVAHGSADGSADAVPLDESEAGAGAGVRASRVSP